MSYLIPAMIGAAIGYFTNWLAIKMLFWPRKPVIVFGRRLPMTPGLLVHRKGELAESIARVSEQQFADPDHLVKVALQANDSGKIWDTAKGSSALRATWMFYCSKYSRQQMEEHARQGATWLQGSGMLRRLINNKIADMPVADVEEMILRVAQSELRAITVFGAILGAVVGGMQPLVSMMVGIVGGGQAGG